MKVEKALRHFIVMKIFLGARSRRWEWEGNGRELYMLCDCDIYLLDWIDRSSAAQFFVAH